MTLLLVFGADDGLLVVADGRLTTTPSERDGGDPYPSTDSSPKTAVAPSGTLVAMASGRATYNEDVAAAVFVKALSEAESSCRKTGVALTIAIASTACFDALVAADASHHHEGRGAIAVVAGFDNETSAPQVWEFTVPDTTQGPRPCETFAGDGLVLVPSATDTADLVRAEFGLVTDDKFFEMLKDDLNDSSDFRDSDFRGSYTLRTRSLDDVAIAVSDALPRLVSTHTEVFDCDGVGGRWVMHELRADRPVRTTHHSWGPMRVDGVQGDGGSGRQPDTAPPA